MKRFGFSLIEFLIYISLFALLSLLVHQWLFGSIVPLKQNVAHTRIASTLHTASDAFVRDIHMAPKQISQWAFIQPDKIGWNNRNQTIVWCVEHNVLIRKHAHHTSVIARDVEGVFTVTHDANDIQLVQCQLHSMKNGDRVSFCAAPRVEGVL